MALLHSYSMDKEEHLTREVHNRAVAIKELLNAAALFHAQSQLGDADALTKYASSLVLGADPQVLGEKIDALLAQQEAERQKHQEQHLSPPFPGFGQAVVPARKLKQDPTGELLRLYRKHLGGEEDPTEDYVRLSPFSVFLLSKINEKTETGVDTMRAVWARSQLSNADLDFPLEENEQMKIRTHLVETGMPGLDIFEELWKEYQDSEDFKAGA